MIEKNVKDKVRRIIAKYEKAGWVFWSYWPVQTGYGKHGIPDCLICFRGYHVAIETKVDSKQPTDRQWVELKGIAKANGYALVIDQENIDDVDRLFELLSRDCLQAARVHADVNRTDYEARNV